jgi:biofilm protein TabA
MIVTDLTHLSQQASPFPRLQTALEFLKNADLQDLPDGRVEIEGSQIYALVQTYNSKPENSNPRFEAHLRYLDIQYIATGNELIGWAPLDQFVPENSYNPEKDVVKGLVRPEAITFVRLSAGQAAILYPEDAHAPGLADGDSSPVKKIVVKVSIAV